MNSSYLSRLAAFILTMTTILGCHERLNDLPYPTALSIYGTYTNATDDSYLEFGRNATLHTRHGTMTKAYRVEKERIVISMKNNERELRRDIHFLILDGGEKLLCSVCGGAGMGVIWKRTN